MEVNVTIQDDAVRALFARLAQRGANMRPVLQEIGLRYERSVLENFDAGRAPDGTPWKPLSQATLLARLSKKSGKGRFGFNKSGGLSARGRRYLQTKRILIEAGDLFGSVHSRVQGNSVIIGTGGHVPYARIHQFGGKAGRGLKVTIPARPYLALNRGTELALADKDRTRIIEILNRHLGL